MTLMIEFTPEIEERLRRQAAALGTDPASYVRKTMEGLLAPSASGQIAGEGETADSDALRAKWAHGAGQADRGELVKPDAVLANSDELKRRRAAEAKDTGEASSPPPGARPFAEWSADLRAWAASHKPVSHVVDDSRDSIYEGRGE